MGIDTGRLLDWPLPEIACTLGARDAMLYALSLGFGADPVHAGQLRFVYEQGLAVVPSMGLVLGWPGLWFMDAATGIDSAGVVNGEQRLLLHATIPVDTALRARNRVVGISDKGAGRGALVHLERELLVAATGTRIATVASTLFCRRDGGCGSVGRSPDRPPVVPDRVPDLIVQMQTLPQASLLYRLNGDLHPLHADPATARAAGFERPILHGLATLGIAAHGLLKSLCDYEPDRLTALGARFSAPVYPGDTLTFDIWRDGQSVRFRGRVEARGVRVLDGGTATVRAPHALA